MIKTFCGNNNADKECAPKCLFQFVTYIVIICAYEGASAIFFLWCPSWGLITLEFVVKSSECNFHLGSSMDDACAGAKPSSETCWKEKCALFVLYSSVAIFIGCSWAWRELKCPQLSGKSCVETWVATLS